MAIGPASVSGWSLMDLDTPVDADTGVDRDAGVGVAAGPAWWIGPLLGVVALAAGLGLAELVVGLVDGAASPVVPVGQEVIDRVPASVRDWAISTFGDDDKAVLVFGVLTALAVVGVAVGVLAVRGHLAAATSVVCVVGALGALAVLERPAPTLGKLAPTLVGTVVSVAVVWGLAALLRGSGTPSPSAEPTMGVDRRRFLGGAAGVGVLAVAAGGAGRLMQRARDVADERDALATALPAPADPAAALPADADLLAGGAGAFPFVTPNEDFYRIDTALVVPQISADSWRLRIHGQVARELELTFADLLARPHVERYVTLSCVSNPVGGDLIGTARWQGVLLADVLDEAGVLPGADQVVSRSDDGWTAGTPTSVIMDGRDALLAVAMNGEPLPPRHGYPVRLVVPGLYGYVSATKWVTSIELTGWDDYDAYWVPRGWSKLGPVKTMARIDTDRPGATAGTRIVGGVAWAVHRGISRVEVRVDEGPWAEATLGGVPSVDTWVQWRAEIGAEPGRHMVEARAFDGEGVAQPAEPAPTAPNGAQGYPRRWIDV